MRSVCDLLLKMLCKLINQIVSMKKLLTVLSLILLVVGLGSCSKDQKQPSIAPTKLSLTPTEIILKVGESKQLTASVEPKGNTPTVIFASDNQEVATVDANGLVKAVAEGTANITAKVGELVEQCAVTVSNFTPASTKGASVVLTTDTKPGEKISLIIKVASDSPHDVWIDINGNNRYDLGEEVTVYDKAQSYTVGEATTISIYGNLTTLWCDKNKLSALDVSNNPTLRELWCHKNKLTELVLTNNKDLRELNCFSNQLSKLDLSENLKLTKLFCYKNQLTSLDISRNHLLTELECYSNSIQELQLSSLVNLTKLWCGENQLISLDISKCTKLADLSCYSNQLSSLDLSQHSQLNQLDCGDNQLISLDVSKNPLISWLRCDVNRLQGEYMSRFIQSLHDRSGQESGYIYIINKDADAGEHNVCTKSQVAIATSKNWKVFDSDDEPYPGSNETSSSSCKL